MIAHQELIKKILMDKVIIQMRNGNAIVEVKLWINKSPKMLI